MPASEMTVEQVRAWKAGWEAVNRREIEELRGKSMERKLHELEMLFTATFEFGRTKPSITDAEIARARWLQLRSAYES